MGYGSGRHRRALPVDVSDRHGADRSEDALRRRRSTSGSRPTKARAGSGSARTSRATIRRRWGTPAVRSPRTTPASRPTRRSSRSRRRRVDGNVIWAGSDDGYVHVTRDGGKNWKNVTPQDLPDFARISLIEASPHAPAPPTSRRTATSRTTARRTSSARDDYGETWTKIVDGIRRDDFARAIREDHEAQGLLFLGTETRHLRLVRRRRHLAVASASTCRTRRCTTSPSKSAIWSSRRTAAVLRDGQHRAAAPGRRRTTTNEPSFSSSRTTRCAVSRSVAIDYYLKQPADTVTIEFARRAGQGRSAPSPARRRRRAAGAAAGRPTMRASGRPPPVVPRKQGLNRFMWDMRYPDATDFPGLIMWAGSVRGPAAPPGTYQVRAHRGGHHEDAGVRDRPQPARRRDRCGSARAVRARQPDQRQGVAGERGGGARPRHQGPDRGAQRQGQRRAVKSAGDALDRRS